MRIKKTPPKFNVSLSVKQFPWNLSKLIRFKRRKWLKIKFSTRFSSLKKKGNVINFRFFRTYRNKIKKLFKIYFAPKLTDRQCQKLLRFNPRYKATFQKLLKVESRIDTLIFRLYMISNIATARELIKKNYFLLNNKAITSSTMSLNLGDVISTSNLFAWQFLYQNMLKTVSSLLKYFSRLFFKFSFPFIIKRKNFHLKEYGKFKERTLKFLNPVILKRLTTRKLFLRYKKIKETTTSKIKPAKKYYLKNRETFKLKRLKSYMLKKVKTNLTLATMIHPRKLPTGPVGNAFNALKKERRQFDFLKALTFAANRFHQVKSRIITQLGSALRVTTPWSRGLTSSPRVANQRSRRQAGPLAKKTKATYKNTKKKKLLMQILFTSSSSIKKKKNRRFQTRLKKQKYKIITSIRKLPHVLAFSRSKARNALSPQKVGSTAKTFKFKNFLPSRNLKRKIAIKPLKYTTGRLSRLLFLQKKAPNLNKKATHFKILFLSKLNKNVAVKSKNKVVMSKLFSRFCLKSRRPKKPRWRRWVPKKAKNFWQLNRLTKKNLYLFRYLKKFNNKYKQYSFFQKLKQNSWVPQRIKDSQGFWQKTSLLLEKKKKKFLTTSCHGAKSIVFEKKYIKSLFVYKNYILPQKSPAKLVGSEISLKKILRVKRKFLRLKGFFRQYKHFKIHVKFAEKNKIYTPILIQYKKINLLFKNKPIAYYFVEANYNDLEFTIVADVDLLFFPYKFFCNQ